MSNEDRYVEDWEAERNINPLAPHEKKGSRWALFLALFGFFFPFGFYQFLSHIVFRYDLGWWEGGGAIVFLLFAFIIVAFETIAATLAIRAKRAITARFALGFAMLSTAFVGWIVLRIILEIAGSIQ